MATVAEKQQEANEAQEDYLAKKAIYRAKVESYIQAGKTGPTEELDKLLTESFIALTFWHLAQVELAQKEMEEVL